MTNLKKLKVSLTKEGAHKLATLIERFPIDEVLQNTNGSILNVNIDEAQSANILSASEDRDLPILWSKVKILGEDTLRRMLMLAIIFSHYKLIDALKKSAGTNGHGVLKSSTNLNGKAFSNFKNEISQLGFEISSSPSLIKYDFREIVSDENLPSLFSELLKLKLTKAHWHGSNSLIDECLKHGFHNVLAITEDQFGAWMGGNYTEISHKDTLLDFIDDDVAPRINFNFKAGHKKAKEGLARPSKNQKITHSVLRHNTIQNQLFKILEMEYGSEAIGSEQSTGCSGTSIDLVLSTDQGFIFFEIKTSPSAKKCIRQAIAQLLEYAFWPNEVRAIKLVIVAEAKLTVDAKKYLEFLREKFNLPLFYKQIDMKRKTLI